MTPTLSDRRRVLGRIASSLIQKNGPLNPSERQQLSNLHREMDTLEADIQTDAQRKYENSFRSYLRNGLVRSQYSPGLTAEERAALEFRDMAVGTPTGGSYPSSSAGYFAPLEFANQVFSAAKEVGPMLETSTVYTTATGRITGLPTENDTQVEGEQISEDAQVTQQDFNIGQVMLSSFKFSSRVVKLSIELSQDAGFPLPEYVAGRLGIRLGRSLNRVLTTGSGSNMPSGLLNAATVGATAVGTSPDDGSDSGTNTIGSADLISLVESVDPIYRRSPGVGFQVNDATLSSIKKLRDKQGLLQKLWKSGRETPSGQDLLLGYPCFTNPTMPTLQTQASSPPVTVTSVLFGALDRYVVRKTPLMVTRLEQRFAEYGVVAFVCFVRADGALIDGGGGAVKALVNVY